MKIRITMLAGVMATVCSGFFGTSASASTYDLATDWSITQNGGSNPWSYGAYGNGSGAGTLTPASFMAFTKPTANFDGDFDVWAFPTSADGGSDPNLVKNITGSDQVFSSIVFPAGQVTFGPYLGPTVARFTAPTTGAYTINAEFQTVQTPDNTAPDAFVYENSTQLAHLTNLPASAATGGTGAFATYSSGVVDLTAGTTIDFVVWGNGNAGGGNKTTEVIATITELPEPSSLVALCGLGAAGILLALRRRRGK